MEWGTAIFIGTFLVAVGAVCLYADEIDDWAQREEKWPPRRRHK